MLQQRLHPAPPEAMPLPEQGNPYFDPHARHPHGEYVSMNNFNDREKAQEAKYANDQEIAFKANARRNKLLGLWVAEQIGLSGDDAAAYARDVIASDFEETGDEDVFRKIWADLQAKSVDISEHRVRGHMEELLAEATRQIQAGE
jgi:hypothetical protein